MGSPSELSLNFETNGYSTAQKRLGDQPEQSQKLDEFLARLEEERLKIEAFKRELPLCMQLLNNVMEAYRQQLENQSPRPVLEEFIPLKVDAGHTTEAFEKSPASGDISCEKASWMTSAQLWTPAESGGVKQVAAAHEGPDHGFDVNPKLVLDNKQRNGGAFHPFARDHGGRGHGVLPELALAPVEELEEKKCGDVDVPKRDGCGRGSGGGGGGEQGKAAASATNPAADGGQGATQSPRKARRCWSPDLHRRFLNALQMLGSAQVATPKQIKELMKVDGLTNDEVKSHLQKYRLHTRRPIPAPLTAASAAVPQLVVLSGIWVPPEYTTTAAAAAAAAAAPGIYAGHAAPAHYCAAPMPQDFYSRPPQAARHLQAPPLQHHRGVGYKVKHETPERDVRGSGDNSESIEDGEEDEEEGEDRGRSESSSWKLEDEKALVPAREDGEVSNGSDATLKL